MAIEIVDFPINSMVDLSIAMGQFTRGYMSTHMGVSENSVPLNPMVLLIIIPIKWLFHWEYTLFSDKPIFYKILLYVTACHMVKSCCFILLLRFPAFSFAAGDFFLDVFPKEGIDLTSPEDGNSLQIPL